MRVPVGGSRSEEESEARLEPQYSGPMDNRHNSYSASIMAVDHTVISKDEFLIGLGPIFWNQAT